MKDKPLSFQIWVVITIFIVIISTVVAITTTMLISKLTDINILICSFEFVGNILKLLICIIIVSIIVAKIISSRITKPISYLEKKVRLIAIKKWDKNIKMNRKDEIGKLAYSIGRMQDNLQKIDKEEELFLQSISHELKTPIMVIQNYCQALKDGFYIENSFEKNIGIIEEEVSLLEGKILKLLYLNSLDYILENDSEFSKVEVVDFMSSIVNRMGIGYNYLHLEVKGECSYINVIREKFQVAIENIIENNLRYAKTYLCIEVKNKYINSKSEEVIEISIINDGDTINEEVLNHLFERFHKGKSGNFGLGLFISRKVIDFHNGKLWVDNLDGGVEFKIHMKSYR